MKAYVGITNNCNAKCFTCNRQVLKGYRHNGEMTINVIDKILDASSTIAYIGEMGDFIFHPKSLDIARRTVERGVDMDVDTIGSIHGEDYWTVLGKICNKENTVIRFVLDDLITDPHRQVDTEKALKNLQTFIDAGGNAHVKTILFNFNQHIIEDMADYLKNMGVNHYETIRSRLYMDEGPLSAPTVNYKSCLDLLENVQRRAPKDCMWHKYEMYYVNELGEVKICCHLPFEGIRNADSIEPFMEPYVGMTMFGDIMDVYDRGREDMNLNNDWVTVESALNSEFNQYMLNNKHKNTICRFRCSAQEQARNLMFQHTRIF